MKCFFHNIMAVDIMVVYMCMVLYVYIHTCIYSLSSSPQVFMHVSRGAWNEMRLHNYINDHVHVIPTYIQTEVVVLSDVLAHWTVRSSLQIIFYDYTRCKVKLILEETKSVIVQSY